MKSLIQIREEAHNRVLIYRSIENIILRPKFTRLWEDSTDEEKLTVEEAIVGGDRKKVIDWIDEHLSLDLGEKPLKQLRSIGKRLGVKYYAQLSHSELVAEILNKEIL